MDDPFGVFAVLDYESVKIMLSVAKVDVPFCVRYAEKYLLKTAEVTVSIGYYNYFHDIAYLSFADRLHYSIFSAKNNIYYCIVINLPLLCGYPQEVLFMNKNNIDPNKLSGLLSVVSRKIGVPPEQLRRELQEGKFDSALSAMDQNDAAKFRQAVSNPQLVEKLMSTPQAKALYKKLSGE